MPIYVLFDEIVYQSSNEIYRILSEYFVLQCIFARCLLATCSIPLGISWKRQIIKENVEHL